MVSRERSAMKSGRPNRVLYDPGALRRNLARLRAALPRGVAVLQVCKGDGYGLGLENAVRMGLAAGSDGFCVGDPEEALAARRVAPASQILLFPGVLPDALPDLAAAGVTVTAHNPASLEKILSLGGGVPFWFKVETGLARYGFRRSEWAAALARYRDTGQTNCVGVYSHFGAGMRDRLDDALTRFDGFLAAAGAVIPDPFLTMAASSHAATQRTSLPYRAVDPGRFLYGMLPAAETGSVASEPVVTAIESRLVQVSSVDEGLEMQIGYGDRLHLGRDGRLGVFPIGTFDGLPGQPPFGTVLIGGRPAPVVGRTLQHSIVDLSALRSAREGDRVTLVGRQGDAVVSFFEFAAALNSTVTALHFTLVQKLEKSALAQ